MAIASIEHHESNGGDDEYFECLTQDLISKGYSIRPSALPLSLSNSLSAHINAIELQRFKQAGIGRQQSSMQNTFVRKNKISWISDDNEIGREWLAWTTAMQSYLNRRLFLGLFSFESHFAQYAVGDFYKRHVDAFAGQNNRVLSVVVYLNHQWSLENGGELVLYKNTTDLEGISVLPLFGTVVVFLSEEFPHEVRTSNRERLSIAGWFRLNTSTNTKVDPPS